MTMGVSAGGKGFSSDRLVAVLLFAQFAVVCVVKVSKGLTLELVWLSHVSLLLAAVGMWTRHTVVLATAFSCVCTLHTLWCIDCLWGLSTGTFPFSATRYLDGADLSTWLATLHHFYLTPVLAWALIRQRQCPLIAVGTAATLWLVLTLICHAATPTHLNINYAHGLNNPFGYHWLACINRMHKSLYLLVLNGFIFVFCLTPPIVVVRAILGLRGKTQLRLPAPHLT